MKERREEKMVKKLRRIEDHFVDVTEMIAIGKGELRLTVGEVANGSA